MYEKNLNNSRFFKQNFLNYFPGFKVFLKPNNITQNKTDLLQNLTICLDTFSLTLSTHWTVYCWSLTTMNDCLLPTARTWWNLPLIITSSPSIDAVSWRTDVSGIAVRIFLVIGKIYFSVIFLLHIVFFWIKICWKYMV